MDYLSCPILNVDINDLYKLYTKRIYLELFTEHNLKIISVFVHTWGIYNVWFSLTIFITHL